MTYKALWIKKKKKKKELAKIAPKHNSSHLFVPYQKIVVGTNNM